VQLQVDAHLVGYDTRMSQLLELSPLIVFLLGFELLGIYWATAALMIACTLLLLIHRMRTGEFKTMHIITTVVVLILGTATLLLARRAFHSMEADRIDGIDCRGFSRQLRYRQAAAGSPDVRGRIQ